jgi:hypothetical protein
VFSKPSRLPLLTKALIADVSFHGRSDFPALLPPADSALPGLALPGSCLASLLPAAALAGLESERMVLTGSIGLAGAFGAFLVTGFASVLGVTWLGLASVVLGVLTALVLTALVFTVLALIALASILLAGLLAALAVGFPAIRATGFDGLATVMVLGFSVDFGVGLADVAIVLPAVLLAATAVFLLDRVGLELSCLEVTLGEGFAPIWLPVLETTLLLFFKLETAWADFAGMAVVRFALNGYPSLNVINSV